MAENVFIKSLIMELRAGRERHPFPYGCANRISMLLLAIKRNSSTCISSVITYGFSDGIIAINHTEKTTSEFQIYTAFT